MERIKAHNTLGVYKTLPPGCIAHLVTDSYSEPFIHAGEWVVVDATDRAARVGDIYVIEWASGRRNVCQAHHSQWQQAGRETFWQVSSMKTAARDEFEAWIERTDRLRKEDAIPMWRGGWTEGPFDVPHLECKLVGAVIGTFQGEFEEPRATDDIEIGRLAEKLRDALAKRTGKACQTQVDLTEGFVFVTKRVGRGE